MLDYQDMPPNDDENAQPGERRGNGRPAVNLQCEIRVGTRAWRKAQVGDLTPGGFQVKILDMPPTGTVVYVRMANLEMMQAEVCWTRVDTAGCKFTTPLNEHVYNHILNFIRA